MTREPTAMELRVAAVAAQRAGLVPTEGAIARHLGDARAYIRAMREPTDEMLDAGWCFSMTDGEQYRRMIDAASPPDSDA